MFGRKGERYGLRVLKVLHVFFFYSLVKLHRNLFVILERLSLSLLLSCLFFFVFNLTDILRFRLETRDRAPFQPQECPKSKFD